MEGSDFTPNELAYLKIFEDYKAKHRAYDVSVFRQPLTNREELLNTIFYKTNDKTNYNLASYLRFTSSKGQITPGKQIQQYHTNAYPFYKLTTEKEYSDRLCSSIVDYIPMIVLPRIEIVVPKESIKTEFLTHYTASITLLLDGPPHANEHGIDDVKKEKWISAQKSNERKRLARLLLDNTIYISHSKLLEKIKECVRKAKEKLIPDSPVTFIVGTPDKSNYYISLLFYHFWQEEGLRLDSVKPYMDELVSGNLIDIDEMAYSGSQTTGTLAKVYALLVKKFHTELIQLNRSIESFRETINFLPVGLVELYVMKKGTNYIVVRVFCSENGLEELRRMPPKFAGSISRTKPPFYLIVGDILPSPSTLFGKNNANKLAMLFGHGIGSPASSVYFNHKIANLPSTYLFSLAYGVVPDTILANPYNEGGINEKNKANFNRYIQNLKPNSERERDSLDFIPFINYCGQYERMMPRTRKNLLEYIPPEGMKGYSSKEPELPQEYRCPYAWYKGINYETGTYEKPPPLPNIPLPHGPTDENFLGGMRRTRKQKYTTKRKTRSKRQR